MGAEGYRQLRGILMMVVAVHLDEGRQGLKIAAQPGVQLRGWIGENGHGNIHEC